MNIAVIGLLVLVVSQSVAQFQTRLGFYMRELQAIQVTGGSRRSRHARASCSPSTSRWS
jgi:hypothetical protein